MSESQQEHEEPPLRHTHEERLEAQLDSKDKGIIAEASRDELHTGEPKHPPLPSTVGPSHPETTGDTYHPSDGENQEPLERIDRPESPEFEFQDAHVPLDVCRLWRYKSVPLLLKVNEAYRSTQMKLTQRLETCPSWFSDTQVM
jgi:hypothetical protein